MRFALITVTIGSALLPACGNTLDFDPHDDLGTGGDMSMRSDAGGGDLGTTDGGSTDGGTGDLGTILDGGSSDLGLVRDGSIDGSSIDLGRGDGGPRPCMTNADCTSLGTATFCQSPDGVCGAGTCASIPSVCTGVFAPVCGCDGVDYPSPCEANRAGTSVASSGSCGATDAGTPDPCGAVATLTRACTTDSSCAVAIHQTDCCGNTVAIGINHSELMAFTSLESACDASYPVCGCPVGPTTTDTGETTFDPTAVRVTCFMGTCTTYVTTPPG